MLQTPDAASIDGAGGNATGARMGQTLPTSLPDIPFEGIVGVVVGAALGFLGGRLGSIILLAVAIGSGAAIAALL